MNNRRRYATLVLAASLAVIVLLPGLAAPSQAQSRKPYGLEEIEPALSGDLAAPATAGSLELLAQVGGEITSVVSDGEYLYVNSGPRLVILTLEANPQVVGRSEFFPDTITSVAVTGETAVVATWPTLFTLDVADPTHPVVVGQFPAFADQLLVAGDYVYTIAGNEVGVVDIADPAQPRRIATARASDFKIYSAVIEDELLLLGEGNEFCSKFNWCYPVDHRITLVDVSQPSQPRLLAELPLEGIPYFATIHAVAIEGDFAYAAAAGIWVIDISDPAEPLALATLDSQDDFGSWQVVHDQIAYALTGRELRLYDLSIPTEPTLLGRLVMPQPAAGLALTGNMVVILTPCGLRMVDVIDPAHLLLLGVHVEIQASKSLVSAGELLYAAGGGAGGSCLQVLDASDHGVPVLLGYLDLSGVYVGHLYIENGLLYASSYKSLTVVDVSVPADLVFLNMIRVVGINYPYCLAFDFVVAGGYAYGDCDEYNYSYLPYGPYGSVPIFRVSYPWAPSWVGQYSFPDPETYYRIAATPGVLYVTVQYSPLGTSDNEIYLIDVHEPWYPALLATVSGANGALLDLKVELPYLYMLYAQQDGVVLNRVDVSNPGSPQITATIISTLGTEVVPARDYVYSPYSHQKLTVYTAPPATTFPYLATVDCRPCGYQLAAAAADQDLLFLGQDDGSLWVYRFTPPEVTGTFLPIVGK
jgi:hypothetical protein